MSIRRLAALGLVCLLGVSSAAVELHELEVRHVRCEVHGGWRHDDVPEDAPADVHTDDHRDLTYFAAALVPVFAPVATPRPLTSWVSVFAPLAAPHTRQKLWALAPKGSPPPV